MSWESSDRRSRLPGDWPRRVAITKRNAGGRCEGLSFAGEERWHVPACSGVGTDCDHIVSGDDHSLSNLQWLSNPCHKRKTSHDSQAWKRQPERPPGLLS